MTHKQAVLNLLSDRKPHSHHELYGLGCVAHSRISDLRRDGWEIRKWREDGLYLYQLKGMLGEAADSVAAVRDGTRSAAVSPSTSSIPAIAGSPPPATSEPLSTAQSRGGGVLTLVFDEHDQATLFGDAA